MEVIVVRLLGLLLGMMLLFFILTRVEFAVVRLIMKFWGG